MLPSEDPCESGCQVLEGAWSSMAVVTEQGQVPGLQHCPEPWAEPACICAHLEAGEPILDTVSIRLADQVLAGAGLT